MKILALPICLLLYLYVASCTNWSDFDGDMAEALVVVGFTGDPSTTGFMRHKVVKEPRQKPVPYDQKSITQGEGLYKKYCQKCHGESGTGDGAYAKANNLQPANLMKLISELTKNKFIFEMQSGNPAMPDWNQILTDRQMDFITSYLIFLSRQE